MEIRVIVDGVERSVSGITESTTCAQIIYALAHATGQKGRFVLIENFRNVEKTLAPLDRPLETLRKCGTQSHCVTFLLKHLDEGPSSIISDTYFADADDRLENSQLVEPSFTSMHVPLLQSVHTRCTEADENGESISSTAVVPSMPEQLYRPVSQKVNWQTMAAERLKNRPPPPAYHEMIEQRFTSLWRQSTPSSSLTPLHFGDIPVDDHWRLNNGSMAQTVNVDNSGVLTRKLSANSLEELIQNQKQVIDQQKFYLAKLDLDIDNDQHREVIQLGRQQENLRAVLNPLRECDWPNRLQHERIELQKITASISEFKQKLDAIANEIKLRTDEEHELKCNILAMEEELKQLEDEVDFAVLSGNHY